MMGPELLAQLVSQYATTLVLYARQWCDAPEDVVQEALLKLVRLKKPPDKLLAWVFRAVRNARLDGCSFRPAPAPS